MVYIYSHNGSVSSRKINSLAKKKLTGRELRAIKAYSESGKYNAAAKAWGSGGQTSVALTIQGKRILSQPHVIEYLKEIRQAGLDAANLSQADITGGFVLVAANAKNDRERLGALDKLARINGMYSDELPSNMERLTDEQLTNLARNVFGEAGARSTAKKLVEG